MSDHPSPGIPSDTSSITFDLAAIFAELVYLNSVVTEENNPSLQPQSQDDHQFRLRSKLNPRNRNLSPFPTYIRDDMTGPGFLQELRFADQLSPKLKETLESIAIGLADMRGRNGSFAAGRAILRSATAHLWTNMPATSRAQVDDQVQRIAQQLFSWSKMPTEAAGGLASFAQGGRQLDPLDWTTKVIIEETAQLWANATMRPPFAPASQPQDGDYNQLTSRIFVAGDWRPLGQLGGDLFTFLDANPGSTKEFIRQSVTFTDDHHFHTTLSRLRKKLANLSKRSTVKVTITTDTRNNSYTVKRATVSTTSSLPM